MLKKLVKYGNSNAIILDKAILELLEIEEGSVIKIKTDGKSIIITPQAKVETQAPNLAINEPFSHTMATMKAGLAVGFKNHASGLPDEKQQHMVDSYAQLITKQQTIVSSLYQNPDFVADMKEITTTLDIASPSYMKALSNLMHRYSPEYKEVEEQVMALSKIAQGPAAHALDSVIADDAKSEMQREFTILHKKNAHLMQPYADMQDNADYQHQAQLLAERFKSENNSEAYLQAQADLIETYVPGYKKSIEEMQAITAKFSNKMSNS